METEAVSPACLPEAWRHHSNFSMCLRAVGVRQPLMRYCFKVGCECPSKAGLQAALSALGEPTKGTKAILLRRFFEKFFPECDAEEIDALAAECLTPKPTQDELLLARLAGDPEMKAVQECVAKLDLECAADFEDIRKAQKKVDENGGKAPVRARKAPAAKVGGDDDGSSSDDSSSSSSDDDSSSKAVASDGEGSDGYDPNVLERAAVLAGEPASEPTCGRPCGNFGSTGSSCGRRQFEGVVEQLGARVPCYSHVGPSREPLLLQGRPASRGVQSDQEQELRSHW